jgi:RNA polymerase sigma-70 factor (ECF subfamily)
LLGTETIGLRQEDEGFVLFQELTDMSSRSVRSTNEGSIGLKDIDALYSYAVVLTGNDAKATDLVHETYLRAMTAKNSLRADASMRSWLFTTLRNVWLNQFRGERNVSGMTVVDESIADVALERLTHAQELCERRQELVKVRKAIQRLPLRLREAILLREYGGFSYHEIAGLLNRPVETVKSRLGRARTILRTMLATNLQAGIREDRGGSNK